MGGIHSGHRQRLRARARQEGLASFQPHEVLELLLMQTIPQRDVNPLAHTLINAFHSVDAVLTAKEEELCTIPGIGERTARWLRAVGSLTDAYARLEPAPRKEISNFAQVAAHLEGWLGSTQEAHLLLCMDSGARLQQTAALQATDGGFPSVREAISTALRFQSAAVCSAHVLGSGGVDRAKERRYARLLYDALEPIDIGYMDHVLVSDGAIFSVLRPDPQAEGRNAAMVAERPFSKEEGSCGDGQ